MCRLILKWLGCKCGASATSLPELQSTPVVDRFLELFKQCALAEAETLGTKSAARVAPHAAVRFGQTSEAVAIVRDLLKDTK